MDGFENSNGWVIDRLQDSAACWGVTYRSVRGKSLSFEDPVNLHRHRPFLALPLMMQPQVKCYKKSRQAGVSENSVTESLWVLSRNKVNVVYTFPTPKQVEDFSNTRFNPALDSSDYLKSLKGDPQNVTLRKVGDGYLFLRSATNEKLGEGVDADVVVFDEIDRMKKNVRIAFQESLSSSKFGWLRELSTPTLPGRGVDETWMRSNQFRWYVKCDACGHRQTMVFPDNILELRHIPHYEKIVPPGSYAFCCSKCKSTRLNRRDGTWIEAHPGREVIGFHINQLQCCWITADEIMQKYRNYKFPQLFWNYVLGEVYMSDSVLLTEATIQSCVEPTRRYYGRRTAGYSHIVVGIDWGNISWAVVLGIKSDGTGTDLIGLKSVKDTSEPLGSTKELARWLEPFEPDCIVADIGYGKDRVAYLISDFPNRVYGCNYLDNSKTVLPKFVDDSHSVSVDRTASLKGMTHAVRAGKFSFPNPEAEPLFNVFIDQMTCFVVLLEEEDTGKIIERVESTRDDHFGHAMNYAVIAMDNVADYSSFDFYVPGAQ